MELGSEDGVGGIIGYEPMVIQFSIRIMSR